MFAVPIPSPVVRPSCGTFTSAVKPAGVSAYDVSGATVNAGGNANLSQPVIPTGAPVGSCHRKLSLADPRLLFQLSIVNVVFNGPSHDVGIVNKGRGDLPTNLEPHSCAVLLPKPSRLTPHRSRLWIGSPGTPHNVTVLKIGL